MSSMGQDFARMYGHELDRMAEIISGYETDADLWSTVGAQKNSAGTVAVHTVGGLLHFVGAYLGGTGYVRDRELEFSERDVPRAEVARRIHACRDTIVPILEGLDDETISGPMPGPLPPVMQGATVHLFLLHLMWHIGWHTGQAYYHRLGLTEPTPV